MARSPAISTIRNAVVTAIKTAMNPGTPGNVTTVNDYRRFWRDRNYFDSLFKRPVTDLAGWRGLINGWMINITAKEREAPEFFRFYRLYRIECHGYMGVQDNTNTTTPKNQKDFIDQVEAVGDQLRMNTAIFGNTEETTPVSQVEQMDVVEIADYRCWYALVTLECEAIDTRFS